MKKILFVTFPRSGHHWLIRSLQAYFGEEFKYCEYYTHCNVIGCTEEITAQKNHDFELSLEIPEGFIPVIQHRQDVVASIMSWYNATVDKPSLKEFFAEKLSFYNKWADKWIGNKYYEITYESQLDAQYETLAGLVFFISGHVDMQKLEEAMEPNIKDENVISNLIKSI